MTAVLALVAPVAEFIAEFECPDCEGRGEVAVRYCAADHSWDTATCRRCGGTGSVTHLPPRDQDEPAEEAA